MVSLEQKKVPFTVSLEAGLPDDRRAGLRGLQLLLVDDEVNAVSALGALLDAEGFIVSTATNGEQALAAAEARRPDVVVLDVEMPGMSGLSLLQRLRQEMPELPAIIMSGFMSHHPGIAEARETTGAAYIGKPVDVDELIRTLSRMFATRTFQP
jgi:DNA-binding NtrC family response regulator